MVMGLRRSSVWFRELWSGCCVTSEMHNDVILWENTWRMLRVNDSFHSQIIYDYSFPISYSASPLTPALGFQISPTLKRQSSGA